MSRRAYGSSALRDALLQLARRGCTAVVRVDDALYERRLGIVSRATIEPSRLTIVAGDARDGFLYVPTPAPLLRWVFRAVRVDPSEFTFVDLGSGLGRAVVAAARRGYRRSIGVEFAAELHEAARTNVARLGYGAQVELVNGDAAEFAFPDDPLVVYLNNPFGERVMRRVIANLTRSYSMRRRPIVVVYQQLRIEDPPHSTRNLDLLEEVAFLSRTDCVPDTVYSRVVNRQFRVSRFASEEVAT
jgi:predicted RNA methylase